jgi:glucosamine--fructose-6-phosphate aminotransferase (isomerizing)
MHEAMASQPSELTRILADPEPVESVATRIRGARRILLAGTGTSYHAANHGAYLLRQAGREAWAIEPFAATAGGPDALRPPGRH